MAAAAPKGVPGSKPRDPRLDFFRGIALLIIVVSHAPGNPWAGWTPSRYGLSDAAEIFVFCSGIASALAFGATFGRSGWLIGTARILQRVWQIYWAHIGSFVVIAAAMVALTEQGNLTRDYVGQLNLVPFMKEPGENLLGLLTLTYVPNYFDILPMYLVILALVPAAMALARIHPGLVGLGAVAIWLAANFGTLNLPAEPWSDRQWFFNPFGWQLLFFIGFGFASGWLRPPPVTPTLMVLAGGVLLLALPLSNYAIRDAIPAFSEARAAIQDVAAKSSQGPLRLLHFLALAYLAWVAVGPGGARLGAENRAVNLLRRIGQQSLAVFITGLLVSRLMGVAFDLIGRDFAAALLVNLAGLSACAGIALLVGWIKGQPWQARPRPPAAATAPVAPAPNVPTLVAANSLAPSLGGPVPFGPTLVTSTPAVPVAKAAAPDWLVPEAKRSAP